MTKIDLYTGYEMDNLIILKEKNNYNVIFEINMWYGYFTDIMDLIPLNENLHPDSVLYNWQKVSGFYDNEWECKRIQEFYNQLTLVESNVNSQFVEAYNALRQICNSTIQNNNRLFIEYL